MSKVNRIRAILEDNESIMLPYAYDIALLGIHHSDERMRPVYSYFKTVEMHMHYAVKSEEESVNFLENQVIPNEDFVIVDDTGV